ncbi:MAG: extracellular solute-binding protein [bacterium]
MKKSLLALASSLLLSLPLQVSAATEVTWWDFLGGGDGVRMKSLIEQFNSSHPDIKINASTLEWGVPFYTKIQTSAAVGEQPDIMTYHLSRFPLAVPSGVLRPFSAAELSSVGLGPDKYFPANWEAANIGGKTYGIPLDIHAMVLYYNKDMLGKAGLLGSNGLPKLDGIANFTSGLKKLKANGAEYGVSLHTAGGSSVWRLWYSMFNQMNGAQFMSGNQVCPTDHCEKVTSQIKSWIDDELMSSETEYPDSIALFTSGKAAMHFNGVWEVPTFTDLAKNNKLGFEWGAVRIPVMYDMAATWADSHAFEVPHSDRKPISQEKLKAVLEVIAWMNKNSLFWATAGHIPGYKPIVDSADYKKMEPNATYAVLAENAAFDPKSKIAGVASPIYDAMQNFIVPSINGQLDPDEAIEMMKETLEPQIE